MRLPQLLCVLIQSNSYALRRAFGTLDSVIPRTAMLLAAAEAALMNHRALLKKTRVLLGEINEFNNRRNDIVHAKVSSFTVNGVHRGLYLVPGFNVTKKYDIFAAPDPEAYRWTTSQIDQYAAEFRRLGGQVDDLIKEVKNTLGDPQSAAPRIAK